MPCSVAQSTMALQSARDCEMKAMWPASGRVTMPDGVELRVGRDDPERVRPDDPKPVEARRLGAEPGFQLLSGRAGLAKALGEDQRRRGCRLGRSRAPDPARLGRAADQGEVRRMGQACQIGEGGDSLERLVLGVDRIDRAREIAAEQVLQDRPAEARQIGAHAKQSDPPRLEDPFQVAHGHRSCCQVLRQPSKPPQTSGRPQHVDGLARCL